MNDSDITEVEGMNNSSTLASVVLGGGKRDSNGINPKKIFNSSSQDQVEVFATLVGDFKPTYGVRTKKMTLEDLRLRKIK